MGDASKAEAIVRKGDRTSRSAQRALLQGRLLFDLVRTLDPTLDRSLTRIAEAAAHGLEVARVGIWFFDPDHSTIACRACWTGGPPPDVEARLSAADHPSYFAALALERTVAVQDALGDHRTAELRPYLEASGVVSLLDVPVWREGRVVAVVCHEHVGTPRRWTADDRRFAASIADLVAMALEVADRARVEAEHTRLLDRLEAERRRLDEVLRRMPVGVVLAEAPSGRVTFANEAAVRLWRKPLDRGETVDDFRIGEMLREDGTPIGPGEAPIARALRRGERVDGEHLWIRRADQSLIAVAAHAAPLRNGGGAVVGAVSAWVDVTEERRSRRALEEDSRLRDRFVAVLGHDLRSPLTTVLVSADLLRRLVDGDAMRHAERILASGRRMKRMVGDLLDLTRARAGLPLPLERNDVDLGALCREVVDEVGPLFPERQVRLRLEGDLQGTWDPGRLAQAVSNLVLNALRYGAPQTPVDVTARGAPDRVELSVHNEGLPADPDRVTRLVDGVETEPLSPGEHGDGLGLGVRIVREVALAHGGSLSLHTLGPGGTTFVMRLPRVATPAPTPDEAAARRPPPPPPPARPRRRP